MYLKHFPILHHLSELYELPDRKLLITTINAHSYNMAQKDALFAEALTNSDVLIPDGASIVKAVKWLRKFDIERITGWDLFVFEMEKLNRKGGICFFLGSNVNVLELILQRAAKEYGNIRIIGYSPRYRPDFTEEENQSIIEEIHAVNPDLIMIGMTAPKQEKWAYLHRDLLKVNCHICAVGAVFDFYAGTVRRAPLRWQKNSLEWLYRLMMEPRRMWKRYIIGNTLFIYYIFKEKFFIRQHFQPDPDTKRQKAQSQHESSFFDSCDSAPVRENVRRKPGVSYLMLSLVSIVTGVVGFFLYPVVYPAVYHKFLSRHTTTVTVITDAEHVQTGEAEENTLEAESQPATVTLPPGNLGKGRYLLIVESFSSYSEAENHVKKLHLAGIACEIYDAGFRRFRVLIASFDDLDEAHNYARLMKSNPYCKNIWISKR